MGGDIELSSLKGQHNVLGTDVVCTAVGGSGQRLVCNLVGGDTQCNPLKVDLRCHKTGYTESTMLFRSVPGVATCPRTCRIHRCYGIRSRSAARIPDRLSSQTVGPHTSSATSRLLLARARVFLRQVPRGAKVVVPTAIPTRTRGKAAGLRSRVQYVLYY